MTKTADSKRKDASRKKKNYSELSDSEKHLRSLKNYEYTKIRRRKEAFVKLNEKVRKAAEKKTVNALLKLQRQSQSCNKNKQRCKAWRQRRSVLLAAASLTSLKCLRVLRSALQINKKNYNENTVKVSEVSVPGQGFGVQADSDIDPATMICEYGGQLTSDFTILQRELDNGNDKILRVKEKLMWWDGKKSKTLGPKLNHECNCTSNCEITWEGDKALICTKASQQGYIRTGDYLTFDYFGGYDEEELLSIEMDSDLIWFKDYRRNHICNKS